MARKKAPEFSWQPDDIWTSDEKAKFRKTSTWIKFRNDFMKRNKNCESCGRKANTLHHHYLNDRASEYSNLDEDRFHSLCHTCHRFIHNLERGIHRKKDPPKPDPKIVALVEQFITVE